MAEELFDMAIAQWANQLNEKLNEVSTLKQQELNAGQEEWKTAEKHDL